MADPVRLAIHAQLQADPTLTGLVDDRVYFQVAPQGAEYPVCVFHRQSNRPRWTFAGEPVEDDLWTVLGVATGSGSASKAEEIADAVDNALNDAALTITGRTQLFLLRDSGLSYSEKDGATLYRRHGAMYRLVSQ